MSIVSLGLFEVLKKKAGVEPIAKEASREVAEATKTVTALEHKVDKLSTKINILITLNIAVLGGFIVTLFAIIFAIL
ncbi:MAG: hypothetical protein LBQ34_04455 [Alphaproteobacteria bacterium]|jgi:hypothetical protein|nr:hypothetical protein [Alphaproteobacteria bacterium]